MAILETAILHHGEILLESQYYTSDNVLDKNVRNSLLQALHTFTNAAFGEEVQSFTLGDYTIVVFDSEIDVPASEADVLKKDLIMIYSIIDKNSDEKAIKKAMSKALFQFTNRYSWNDIRERQSKKFEKFKPRLQKAFGDMILKSEDRFKSLF